MNNEEQDIRAGDGIVMLSDGDRGIVRARVTGGYVRCTPTWDDNILVAVIVDFPYAEQCRIEVGTFRRETFSEHMTRPTGFGKTPWPLFAIIQLICLGGIVVSVLSWPDGGWVGLCAVLLTEAALVFGTWMNYTRRWV